MVSKSCSSWWRRWFIPKNPIVGGLSPKTWNKSWESSESRQMGTIKSFFIHQFISYHKKIPSDGNHTIIKKIMFYHINSYHIPKKYRNPMIFVIPSSPPHALASPHEGHSAVRPFRAHRGMLRRQGGIQWTWGRLKPYPLVMTNIAIENGDL
jgi:hypothetical protein